MTDAIDRAQELDHLFQERSLALHQSNRSRPVTTGLDCLSCGFEIAPERRAALPGCCLCIDCQTEFEVGMG